MEKALQQRNLHVIKAPFGAIFLHYDDGQLSKVDFSCEEPAEVVNERYKTKEDKALEQYLAGDIHALDGWPLSPNGTDFRKQVWEVVRAIPPGHTRTYGDVAKEIGSSPRAVGQALGNNPIPIFVPCHRVVGKGSLCGFAHTKEGIKLKKFFIDHERKHLKDE
ncbi:MAG: methylated-DNA--[protein]-cysteine S-methyltransferase [Burkholderiales bacterium]|nr:methylated-DNA--[protein]-cysteine S-methyltransferase [Burkholderiales bacterium]